MLLLLQGAIRKSKINSFLVVLFVNSDQCDNRDNDGRYQVWRLSVLIRAGKIHRNSWIKTTGTWRSLDTSATIFSDVDIREPSNNFGDIS